MCAHPARSRRHKTRARGCVVFFLDMDSRVSIIKFVHPQINVHFIQYSLFSLLVLYVRGGGKRARICERALFCVFCVEIENVCKREREG